MGPSNMEWFEEVSLKYKRKNQILFSKECELFQDLSYIIKHQNRRTMVLWALNLAEESVCVLEEKYPNEHRPRTALELTRFWAAGEIKMTQAKRAILDCHAMAKEITIPEDIALCHAIGQACGVVHTVGHALGYPIYELTAIVRRYGIENCRVAVETRAYEYVEKLRSLERLNIIYLTSSRKVSALHPTRRKFNKLQKVAVRLSQGAGLLLFIFHI